MRKLKYLFLIMVATFMSVTNVNADTYQLNDLEIMGYNNNGSSLTTPSEFGCSDGTCGMYITTNANSYGGAWIIESPISLLSNYTYTLSLRIRTSGTSSIALSSKNNITVGTSIANAKSRYEASNFNATMNYSKASGDNTLQFAFTPTSNGTYLVIPFTTATSSSANYFIDYLIIDNMGNSGISQSDINNSLSSQTNEINNSINNSTNTITGSITDSQNNINQNIDDMEQSIIDSNKETQDVIKEQFETCRDSVNLLNLENFTYSINGVTAIVQDGIITLNGTTTATTVIGLVLASDYTILDGKTFTLSANNPIGSSSTKIRINVNGYYDTALNVSNKVATYIKDSDYDIINNRLQLRIDADTELNNFIIKPQIQLGSFATDWEPYGEEICTNRIDETNDKLDDLNQNITSEKLPNLDGLSNSAGWLPAGAVDSILNLPLSLFNSLTTVLSATCQPVNLTFPFINYNYQLPCVDDIYAKIGHLNSLLNTIGVIVSALILYKYFLSLYKWVDDTLTFRENNHIDNWGGV